MNHIKNNYFVDELAIIWKKLDNGQFRPVKPQKRNGYLSFKIYNSITKKKDIFYVHKVFAKFYVENPKNHEEVRFLDRDRMNITVDNLEWVKLYSSMIEAEKY
jgi:hypothetical protein